ncbi:MAG: hypothetical protein RBT11_19655 [Desulfobacterales bacterium]|jgi:hypothetical protein|nr:hypothetical protein [Desulfobacterales bacterium]
MSFSVEEIGGFNPFEWEKLKCPVCGEGNFTSLSHSGVYCDKCNAQFRVRTTAGDPGCVIDCMVNPGEIYAPKWECTHPTCGAVKYSFEKPECPKNSDHTMERAGFLGPWEKPDKCPDRFCLVLKHGDYCSGWMFVFEKKNTSERLDSPTQAEWDQYQEKLRPASGIGSTVNARFAIIKRQDRKAG